MSIEQRLISESTFVKKDRHRRPVHITKATHALQETNPDVIPVQNELDTPVMYDGSQLAAFRQADVLPLSELQYLLSWANKLRINGNDRHFDVPCTEALLGMMWAFMTMPPLSSSADSDQATSPADITAIRTVPFAEYRMLFDQLSQLENPTRAVVIAELNNFVARFV